MAPVRSRRERPRTSLPFIGEFDHWTQHRLLPAFTVGVALMARHGGVGQDAVLTQVSPKSLLLLGPLFQVERDESHDGDQRIAAEEPPCCRDRSGVFRSTRWVHDFQLFTDGNDSSIGVHRMDADSDPLTVLVGELGR
jgi:hypothetical protein